MIPYLLHMKLRTACKIKHLLKTNTAAYGTRFISVDCNDVDSLEIH